MAHGRIARDGIGAHDHKRGGNVAAPVDDHHVERANLELAQLRALDVRVERTDHNAARHVAHHVNVVAGRVDRCPAFNLG